MSQCKVFHVTPSANDTRAHTHKGCYLLNSTRETLKWSDKNNEICFVSTIFIHFLTPSTNTLPAILYSYVCPYARPGLLGWKFDCVKANGALLFLKGCFAPPCVWSLKWVFVVQTPKISKQKTFPFGLDVSLRVSIKIQQ